MLQALGTTDNTEVLWSKKNNETGSQGSNGSTESNETHDVISNFDPDDDGTRSQKNYKFACLSGFLLLLAVIYCVIMRYYKTYVFHQTFVEQDPGLSYPYVENETVPYFLLLVLIIFVPQIALCTSYIMFGRHVPTCKYAYLTIINFGYIMCMLITSAIVNTMKIMYGEPRPSFFGICNYQGYRDALNSGNYTSYDSLTEFGRFGDDSHCSVSQDEINDAYMSFPSGHAALIFSSIIYASMVLLFFRNRSVKHYVIGIFVSACYVGLAVWVCYTRVMDYKHKSSDVLAGVIIGCIIAYMIYKYILDLLKIQGLLKGFDLDNLRISIPDRDRMDTISYNGQIV